MLKNKPKPRPRFVTMLLFSSQFQVCQTSFSKLNLLQVRLLRRIKEKENERDLFECQISNVDLSRFDEREKNMVTYISPFGLEGLVLSSGEILRVSYVALVSMWITM